MVEILTPEEAGQLNITVSECLLGGKEAVRSAVKSGIPKSCKTCGDNIAIKASLDKIEGKDVGRLCPQIIQVRNNITNARR